MFRTTVKGILAHKLRLATTALAVMLGVAFMVGTLVLSDTIHQTFNNLFATVYKGTDAVVRAKAVFKGPNGTGDQRGRVDASLVGVVKGVRGVAVAEGSVLGYARLVGKNGEAIGNPNMGPPALGGNWINEKQLNPFTLVAGQPPRADNDVVIDRKSASDGNYTVGDTATVLTQAPPQHMHISGIVKFGSADSPGGASVALFTTPVAQQLVAQPGKFDSINVVADKGLSQHEITSRISPVLPSGVEAVTGAKVTKEAQDAISQGLSFFTTFLLIFAVVALLVGAFMIFNTFSITVAQRTRENALLRAIGASRRQVLTSVLLEALAVGLLASLAGILVGLGVAAGLKALLAAFGFDIPAGGVVFKASTPILAVLVGVIVTVFAAFSPARKAGKVPPIAAMREVTATSGGYGSKQRIVIGLVLLIVGVTALFIGLFTHPSNAVAIVGVGALLVFFAVSVLGRTVALPLSRTLGAPLPRLRGVAGLLARQNAMRNPKRTAASASALMIGVGLVAFITIFASSTKASINATVNRAFLGDFVIDSGAGMTGGVDPGLAQRLNTLPQVQAAFGLRFGSAKINGSVQPLIGVDPAKAFQVFNVKPLKGSPRDLNATAIGIYKNVAKDKHLQIGDSVNAEFASTGTKPLRVALIYGENRPAGDYILGIAAYEANFDNHYDSQVFVKKAPGVSSGTALAAVKQVAKDYPGAKVLDRAGYKREQTKPVDQLLALVYVLLALAILIALLGIANTLALSIFERTRELGILRAVGMTRSQLRSTTRWESVIIALQGTVLGLVVGLFFGWSLVRALHGKGIDQFSLPLRSLVAVVVLAGLAGVVAAIWPSRRAAKLDVLRAVSAE
jgi:putative ABC transport system permease protein